MKNRLISERTKAGISQVEMAKRLGLKTNTYNQYEHGIRSVPLEVAEKISKELGVAIDQIFLPTKFSNREQV